MRIGGGREQFMVTLPVLVAVFMMIYALGGPDRTLAMLDRLVNDVWGFLRNALR